LAALGSFVLVATVLWFFDSPAPTPTPEPPIPSRVPPHQPVKPQAAAPAPWLEGPKTAAPAPTEDSAPSRRPTAKPSRQRSASPRARAVDPAAPLPPTFF
jgi:hypothetical protein